MSNLRYRPADRDWTPPSDNIEEYGAYWRLRNFVHRVRRSSTALAAALQQRLMEVRRMLPIRPERMRVTAVIDGMSRPRGPLVLAQDDYRHQVNRLARRMQGETTTALMTLVQIQLLFRIRRERRLNQMRTLIANLIERASANGVPMAQRFRMYDQGRAAALRLPPSMQRLTLQTLFVTEGTLFHRLNASNLTPDERTALTNRVQLVSNRYQTDIAGLPP